MPRIRYELETPLRLTVISALLPATTGAGRQALGSGLNDDLDDGHSRFFNQADLLIDEGLERMDAIEDSLELHLGWAPVGLSCGKPILIRSLPRMHLTSHSKARANP